MTEKKLQRHACKCECPDETQYFVLNLIFKKEEENNFLAIFQVVTIVHVHDASEWNYEESEGSLVQCILFFTH